MVNTNENRCDVLHNVEIEAGRRIKPVPEPNYDHLDDKSVLDYRRYRGQFLTWLLQFGKDESKAVGYSPYTVHETGLRTAAFDRWVWSHGEGYRVPPDEADAREYMRSVAVSDRARATKGKIQEAYST